MLEDIFDSKQHNEDGSASDEFFIKRSSRPCLLLRRDMPVSEDGRGRTLKTLYFERVAMHKAFDGKKGRREWRTALLEVLRRWLASFPECASKKRCRLSSGSCPADKPVEVPPDDL